MAFYPATSCCCSSFRSHPFFPEHCVSCKHSIRAHPPTHSEDAHRSHRCGECWLGSEVRSSDSLSRFVRLMQGNEAFFQKLRVTHSGNLSTPQNSLQRTRSTACESSPSATLRSSEKLTPKELKQTQGRIAKQSERAKPQCTPESSRIRQSSPLFDTHRKGIARSKSAKVFRVPFRSPQRVREKRGVATEVRGEAGEVSRSMIVGEYYSGVRVAKPVPAKVVRFEDDLLKLVFVGTGHKSGLTDVEVLNGLILTSSSDYCVGAWPIPAESQDPYQASSHRPGEVTSPKWLHRAHRSSVNCIRSMRDGRYCTAGSDSVLKVVSIQVWSESTQVAGLKTDRDLIHSIDVNSALTAGAGSGQIYRWDLTTLQSLSGCPIKDHLKCVNWVASYTPQTYLSASSDCTVKLWDVRSQRSIITFSGHVDAVTSVVPHFDEGFYSASDDGGVFKWDVRRNAITDHWAFPHPIVSLTMMRGRLVSSGDSIHIWQPRAPPKEVRFHTGTVRRVRYFDKDQILASVSWDRSLAVWRVI